MKPLVFWLTMMMACMGWAADPAFPFPEWDEPHKKYLEALAKLRAAREEKLVPVNRTYAGRLDALLKTFKDAGNAEGVTAVQAEQERLKTGAELTQEQRNAMPGLLRVQRTSYEKECTMIAPDAKAEAQADAAWKTQLQALYPKLVNPLTTDRNARAKAQLVRTELDRIAAKSAPAPTIFPSVAGVTPPAGKPPEANPAVVKPPKAEEDPKSHFPPTEEAIKTAAEQVHKLKLTNSTEATEAEEVLAAAVSRDLELIKDVKEATLERTFDAAKKPMNRSAGGLFPLRGSNAKEVVVGSSTGMMLWGPYDSVDPGRHLIVYRFKFRGEVKGERSAFLDVAYKGNTYASLKPRSTSTPANEWHAVAVPINMSKKRPLEYRFWPQGNEVGIDRIYIYRLGARRETVGGEADSEAK